MWCVLCLLLGLCYASSSSDFTLTVLHTNDVHSHFLETDPFGGRCKPERKNRCVGGVARHLTLARKFRKEKDNVLFLNAGDYFQGTSWYTVLKYRPLADVVKLLRHDAMCLGNHEFDDGPEGLAPYLRELEGVVPVVTSNADFSASPALRDLQVNKSILLNVGGMRVGIIGAVTPDTKTAARPGNVTFEDDLSSIRKEAIILKRAGIKIIIALTHVGYNRDQEIAREIPQVSLVVGGHSHTLLYTGKDHPKEDRPGGEYPTVVTRSDGTKALVVQAYWFGKYMGHLDVTYNDAGDIKSWSGKPILLDQTIEQDQEMLDVLDKYLPNVTAAGSTVVGSSKVLLMADNGICRRQECNIGNFIADAFFDFFAGKPTSTNGSWSDVNGCLLNGGSIRGSIGQSETVIRDDLLSVMPFGNSLVVVTLTGAHLWDLFEHSVANYSPTEARGEFLQVSGFLVTYDVSQSPMKRVVSVEALCTNCSVPRYEHLDDPTLYRIVTMSYMYQGGDGYDFSKAIHAEDKGYLDLDVFQEYFTKRSPVQAKLEHRIRILSRAPTQENDGSSARRSYKGNAAVLLLTCVFSVLRTSKPRHLHILTFC
ncbi:protein 5NUC-like [Ornithodoros turicata]|uniref:protein 5NUC-like n=1 Tax=Ornithodoros turicata TaxID=34597 RepID=UPI003138D893